MFLYSLIFPIISIMAIVWFAFRYLKGKNSIITTVLWTLFWIVVAIFSLFPNLSNQFAKLVGITRGLDFIIILVFIILFYTVLRLYFIVDKLQNDLNTVVKQVAIQNEITLDDEEE
ncbi:DUF2304 family protein [uncultured Methanobrevibacter sp.]|uniref:DUF2304 family protein n=1 Tax=uncultured Methanobrevibacter sp. TaxID=253161 RepID=UPI0025DD41ED|nr:DUF2304 family protein [uncultured Methanobrevibacter sp.]